MARKWRFPRPSLNLPSTVNVQRWSTRLMAWALALFAIYQLVRFGGKVLQSDQINAQIAEQQTAVARLADEQAQLQGRLDFARSDGAIERIAREQLDLVRPEDTVLHIMTVEPEPPTPPPTPPPFTPTPTPVEPNWQGWWQAFSNP